MRPASCGITPETALVFACLGWPVPAVLALALCWFAFHFFRDPERVVPTAPGLAVSPADGRVIRIERKPDPLTGDERTCISIFMNVFSVHVNRSWPGKFVNAAYDKAATDNERCGYLLRGEDGAAWTMVQIAGLIARRIVCRMSEGDALERGQRYGMIRFGSRVDLYLPEGYVPSVNIGEQVFAGQSTLATRN